MGDGSADAVWLETLNRICGLAAHEVKGALNGVSVNLEVVRSRAEKPDAPASNVSKFANTASQQLDAVIAMTDSLLALARPAREPVELARVIWQIGALLVPAARADGRRLSLEGSLDDSSATSAAGSATRAAIGGCLLAAATTSTDARCQQVAGGEQPTIRIESCDGAPLTVGPEIVAVALDAGIHVVAESSVITISFPRAGGDIAETA